MSSDRPPSLLTPEQRRYLRPKEDPESGRDRDIRYRIRERTLNGLVDFWLLLEYLEYEDWEILFDPERGEPDFFDQLHNREREFPHSRYRFLYPTPEDWAAEAKPKGTVAFESMFADVIAFLYIASTHLSRSDFEGILDEGITKALREKRQVAETRITLRDPSRKKMLERAETHGLNVEEMRLLTEE